MHNMYLRLAIMTKLSFISMYVLMYMMVDAFGNVYSNVNQLYMAAMMTAPMVIFELALMRMMYKNNVANAIILFVSVAVLCIAISFMRWQTGVDDKQFLRSMIPHHGGAVLMCNEAPIEDAEIKKLCEGIISSQQSEIDWMKAKLAELDKR